MKSVFRMTILTGQIPVQMPTCTFRQIGKSRNNMSLVTGICQPMRIHISIAVGQQCNGNSSNDALQATTFPDGV